MEDTFDLVMVAERWDESMVLLRDLLCWEFRSVAWWCDDGGDGHDVGGNGEDEDDSLVLLKDRYFNSKKDVALCEDNHLQGRGHNQLLIINHAQGRGQLQAEREEGE